MKKIPRNVFTVFENPIRSEKFSEANLERHAEFLANAQEVSSNPKRGINLAARVKENENVLVESYRLIVKSVHENRAITPAAQWLINNFFIIEDQLKDIKDHLPPQYYRELPKLSSGPLVGYPRVYGIAWEYIAHNESLFDSELLKRFVKSYQRVQPLTIGELWAISITLRIVMIENLRRLSAKIVGSQMARKKADLIADELLGLVHINHSSTLVRTFDEILKELRSSDDPLKPGFAVQLIQRLRFQDSKVAPVLKLIEERLEAFCIKADKIVSEEHNNQTVANATVRNIITSMRLMSAFDWQEFFEEVSLVDEVFRSDPLYQEMDFTTRDRYRHGLEELARGLPISEIDIAKMAIRKGNLGHYLISFGRYEFEKELGFKISLGRRLIRMYVSNGKVIYIGSIMIMSFFILYYCSLYSGLSIQNFHINIFLVLLGIFPALEMSITLVNRLTVDILSPWHIPRLKLSKGIPPHLKTFIVVPTMLVDVGDIDNQVEQLEVHYLSNPDGSLCLALLSDWKDALSEHTETDDLLYNSAKKKIKALNKKYGKGLDGKDRFFIFHRKRKWNESERKWMGWERKRGKLEELNRLLRGANDTTFIITPEIMLEIPLDVKYVITLDADTRIPKGTVAQMVGAMAHPLNRPLFDLKWNRVIQGYGILQPRITPFFPTAKDSTLFQRLFSGACGIDPYSSAVSDVYQDLFGEGSYTGKGIYDIDIFEQSLNGRVPENRLLSHDLFEGNFARCGLLNDVEFFEDFPSHFQVSLSRMHRWIRGDWQLLPWILGRQGSSLSMLGRLKMIDNLRRSLTQPMSFCLLVVIFFISDLNITAWIVLVLASIGLPFALPIISKIISYQRIFSTQQQLYSLFEDMVLGLSRFLFTLSLLPHQSLTFLDAIIRTLYRLIISKRNLLEWTTAATSKLMAGLTFKSFFLNMIYTEILLIAVFLGIIFYSTSMISFIPFLILWALAPFMAWQVSMASDKDQFSSIVETDVFILRSTGRRIWLFFSTFVTENENFLPPDNIQEDADIVIAHRSSPTNFGLYLMSIVAANDFSWIGILEMIDRLDKTLMSMKKLSRHKGHFFNWYQTTNLEALGPRYISSVDNGNLAGHLLVIEQRLKELLLSIDTIQCGFPQEACMDSFRALKEVLLSVNLKNEKHTLCTAFDQLSTTIKEFEEILALSFDETKIDKLISITQNLVDQSMIFSDIKVEKEMNEIFHWSKLIQEEVLSHLKDIDLLKSNVEKDILKKRINKISVICRQLFFEMDFNFLYNHKMKLFSIGFRISDNSLDNSHYDLMASEARLLSFVAIAKGDVSSKHWFRLGRGLTLLKHGTALLSWSGSMFEYLMPSLIMKTPVGSLIEQTCRLIVQRQILYGKEKSVPWGISESVYNERDVHFTYQYSDFGVPGLGLKRGLENDLVIAPYSTILAAMYDPINAIKNLKRMSFATGIYGFYDAIDFTKGRLPENTEFVVVKTYMAHHLGMSLISIANVLCSGIFYKRFHLQPLVKATELLLQERSSTNVVVSKPKREGVLWEHLSHEDDAIVRRYHSASQVVPHANLLSNGTYAVMITAAGSGYSRFRDLDVTRWREDITLDNYGCYIYLRQVRPNHKPAKIWSAGFQPTTIQADLYNVDFTEDRVKITRVDGDITSVLEIFVSPEDNAEMRRLFITNNSMSSTEIEVTSYAEVVLNTNSSDMAHSAFSNLFVKTEYIKEMTSLLATRRPRTLDEPIVWLAHVIATDANAIGEIEYETDRSRFIGRGRNVSNPVSVFNGVPLSNTVGPVIDPIVSLRVKVKINAGSTVKVTFSTAIASTREEVLCLADKLRDHSTFERVSNLAWTQAQVTLHYLGIKRNEANLFQELASRVLYLDSSLRPSHEVLIRNQKDVKSLWAFGISGDYPIVVVRIDDIESLTIIKQLLRAQEYWGTKRLVVDLVILNEQSISYAQELQELLEAMVRTSILTSGSYLPQTKGKVFVLQSQILSVEEQDLLQTAARVILIAKYGSLADQVKKIKTDRIKSFRSHHQNVFNLLLPLGRFYSLPDSVSHPIVLPPLDFFNGIGGFANQGKEYVICLENGECTPAPWINVIANPEFGFQVSESGSGFTWSLNSSENKITPWSNDPVCDPSGESFYIVDNDNGKIWGPTALPIRIEDAQYVIYHGQGYSRFELFNEGIYSQLTQFVHMTESVKISKLELRNDSNKRRSLSIIGYVEWVLGVSRVTSAPYIITELLDNNEKVILARNPWSTDYGKRISFATFLGGNDSYTCDRIEFFGRNGSTKGPDVFINSGKMGIGLDPCAAIFKNIFLKAGESITVIFVLGQADSRDEIKSLLAKMNRGVDDIYQAVVKQWEDVLTKVQVETPDQSMNIMLNRWSLYQTIVCRLWARSAFYQAGGAFGFRDQLQDSMALVLARPEMTRAQILIASSRQFVAGDVQHWWHPPHGQGVRTHFSDDLLWLPFVVSHYLKIVEDFSILDENVSFLNGPTLRPDQENSYYVPSQSEEVASIYEHCARAIDRSLGVGVHGLPLMGSGDWNDGMNFVGIEGKGESVWLAWFLYSNLMAFSKIARTRNNDYENERATKWSTHANKLITAIEKEAWDGAWYRRAFYDDGTPLGSSSNLECQIDSIAQSWAVISGAMNSDHQSHELKGQAQRAMDSVEQHLMKKSDHLLLLFSPPFDQTPQNPGYIKGYHPGVRENGGQYTHAAIWCIYAYAGLSEGQKAVELFSMLNPINHSSNLAKVYRYKVEPYVMAADIYSEPSYLGRGGWTWYTGASAWMYRAGIESILGLKVRGNKLFLVPNISPEWKSYKMVYKYLQTTYEIEVKNPKGLSSGTVTMIIDGKRLSGDENLLLVNDKINHMIVAELA